MSNETHTRTLAVGALALAAIGPTFAGSAGRALIPSSELDPIAAAASAEHIMFWVSMIAVALACVAAAAAIAWTRSAPADVRFRLLALGVLRIAAAIVAALALQDPSWQVWQLSLSLAVVDAGFWLVILFHAATLTAGLGGEAAERLAKNARQLGVLVVAVRMSGLLAFVLPSPWDGLVGPCYRAASLVAFAALSITLLRVEKRLHAHATTS